MSIRRKTGIILSIDSNEKTEMEHMLKRFSDSIDAISLKEPVLLHGSVHIIREIKDFMKKNDFNKPIIIDYRLDQEELDYLGGVSGLFKNKGAYGMTIMAIYGKDFVESCKKEAKIKLFAVVDIGTQFFHDHFDDDFVLKNAIFAKNSKCAGIVMTCRHLDRIRKVKKVVGSDLQLLATIEKESRVGQAASAGADFEIVPCELLK